MVNSSARTPVPMAKGRNFLNVLKPSHGCGAAARGHVQTQTEKLGHFDVCRAMKGNFFEGLSFLAMLIRMSLSQNVIQEHASLDPSLEDARHH